MFLLWFARLAAIFFPAMNTFVHEHPFITKRIRIVGDVVCYSVSSPVSILVVSVFILRLGIGAVIVARHSDSVLMTRFRIDSLITDQLILTDFACYGRRYCWTLGLMTQSGTVS